MENTKMSVMKSIRRTFYVWKENPLREKGVRIMSEVWVGLKE